MVERWRRKKNWRRERRIKFKWIFQQSIAGHRRDESVNICGSCSVVRAENDFFSRVSGNVNSNQRQWTGSLWITQWREERWFDENQLDFFLNRSSIIVFSLSFNTLSPKVVWGEASRLWSYDEWLYKYTQTREREKASVNFGKSWFVFHQRRSKHKVVGLISGKFTVLKPSGLEWEELMSHLLELHRDYSKLTVIDIQRIGNLEILIGCKVTHQVAWIIHFQLPVVDYSLFFFFGEFIFLSRAFFDNAIHIRAAEKDKVCKLISRLNTKSLALLVSCE